MSTNNSLSDMNLLYDAFRSSMKGSSWKSDPQLFEMNFLSELVKLSNQLESETYKTSEGTEFVIRERGKVRYIHGGTMRDRVVRHALCDGFITDSLHPYLIYNNGASQKGKGVSFARAMFEKDLHNHYLSHGNNDGYICFVDLSKFYDNIRHDKLRELMLPKLDKEIHWLVNHIIDGFKIDVSYMTEEEYTDCLNALFDSVKYRSKHGQDDLTGEKYMPKSIDVGDQFSQNVGVFFPTCIDNYVKIVRGVKRYGRYMDDIYFICDTREEARSIIDGIMNCAEENGMFVNRKKTKIVKLSDNYIYLQIKYTLSSTGKVIKRVNPKTITRERRKLKKYKRLMDDGRMPYDDIKQAYKSWMGNYAKIMSKQQVKNMKQLYFDLFKEDVKWKNSH